MFKRKYRIVEVTYSKNGRVFHTHYEVEKRIFFGIWKVERKEWKYPKTWLPEKLEYTDISRAEHYIEKKRPTPPRIVNRNLVKEIKI